MCPWSAETLTAKVSFWRRGWENKIVYIFLAVLIRKGREELRAAVQAKQSVFLGSGQNG